MQAIRRRGVLHHLTTIHTLSKQTSSRRIELLFLTRTTRTTTTTRRQQQQYLAQFHSTSTTPAMDNNNNNIQNDDNKTNETTTHPPLPQLTSTSHEKVHQLDLSQAPTGEVVNVKLEEIGPVVVNVDGTVSRITNWHELNEFERKNLERMVLKRNRERLEALKKQQDLMEQQQQQQ